MDKRMDRLAASLTQLGEAIAKQEQSASRKVLASSVRKPPKAEAQPDFFAPALYDVGTKDSRSIMDVAVFRLSKKDKRPGDIIRYDMPDGFVQVSAGPAGMASVWDYDIVLMAVSHLTASVDRWRTGKGDKPSRVFRPNVADILKFCRRGDGGKQHDDLVAALTRLSTTHVAVERTRKNRSGRVITVSEGEALISRYRVVSGADTGKVDAVEIELPDWIYREVVEMDRPDVLTVHPDYFLIEPGVGRFLYRLARRAAGKGQATWSFRTIYERSGSAGSFKEFSRMLRKLIETNDLPEYIISEQEGQGGSMLVMEHRSATGG
jgi:plasmid replication initiation protein